jgi:acyl carrier protein
LSNTLDIKAEDIDDKASMLSIENWDSLNHIKVVLEIEKDIQRKLSTEEIISIYDLESISKILSGN